MSELRNIPNVGKATEQDLIAMGYTTIESLKGKKADELYAEECALRGCALDRCQLYLYRAVEYFVNTENPDPMKCRWWYWKDEFVEVSPCGAVCVECSLFPLQCAGCRKIKGKVFWLRYTGDACCRVYDCCVKKGLLAAIYGRCVLPRVRLLRESEALASLRHMCRVALFPLL